MASETLETTRISAAARSMDRNAARQQVRSLDRSFNQLWDLGRNLLVAWCPSGIGIDVLAIPQHRLTELAMSGNDVLSGTHAMMPADLEQAATGLGVRPRHVALPAADGAEPLAHDVIASVIRRYSVTRSDYRAGVLFDIVGFSLYSPLEQVTLLNSLAYSINVAHSRAMAKNLRIDLGRSTTGDGFYVWNRDNGITADLNLFYLMMLTLADNALARLSGDPRIIPGLRTCFHVASHYEYYQAEGLNPAISGYIVGDLTIELDRMINKALPGQILIGNFARPNTESALRGDSRVQVTTPMFIGRCQDQLDRLNEIALPGGEISGIKIYLTGQRVAGGSFNIKKYSVSDKHELRRDVFNAKVNIYRKTATALYLGLKDNDLGRFDAIESEYFPETV